MMRKMRPRRHVKSQDAAVGSPSHQLHPKLVKFRDKHDCLCMEPFNRRSPEA
jgi:hypothetical protein